MKPFRASLLSLCALTLLSACGNHDDPAAALAADTGGGELNIPGEQGPDGRANIQMIRAGLHEANEVRRRNGLSRLNHDVNLTIQAQQRAREQCRDRGNGPQYPNGPGSDDYYRRQDDTNDGVPALPALGGPSRFAAQAAGFTGPRGPGAPQYPQYPQYPQQPGGFVAENVARGFRSAEQVFLMWQQRSLYSQNLLNPAFRRQGLGYCDGIWIHLLAN